MKIPQRYKIKKILLGVMWVVISCGCVLLLAAAVHTRNSKLCKGLEINIHGVSNNFFIDKNDVKKIIGSYVGDSLKEIEIKDFNLVAMEAELKREVWIKNAELFFDNNEVLQATVEEREPIARIFNNSSSFYIDSSNMMLPVSEKISAKLPVFTGFPSENKVLSKADSSLLKDIKNLSIIIQQDSFLNAMIDQVDITSQRNFEMIPKIGDQVIIFGDASDAEQKFNKLKLFYKKVMIKYGWNRYSIINLQYKGQVVGKLKGKDDVSADSLRTQEIMRAIAINSARAANDSLQMIMQDNEKNTTSLSLIDQSIERDDDGDDEINPLKKFAADIPEPAKPPKKPVLKNKPAIKKLSVKMNKALVKPTVKPVTKPAIKPVAKQVIKKPAATKPALIKPAQVKPAEKPKALMQKKNDY